MVTFQHGAPSAPDFQAQHYTDLHTHPAGQRPGGAQ